MAVTCLWKNLLGQAMLTLNTPDGTQREKIEIYGGGNCLAIFCYENKNLYNFWIDNQHVSNVAKQDVKLLTENLSDIKIFAYKDKVLNKETCDVAKVLLKYGIEFTYVKKEKYEKPM